MDIRHLVEGSTVYLPVLVAGALLSVGDGHAAQGDGEICMTAIECAMTITCRLSVEKRRIRSVQFLIPPGPLTPLADRAGWFATTGYGSDLLECARQAVRSLLEWLVATHGLTREEAYVLASVVADLKISEVVSANRVVSAYLPLVVFAQKAAWRRRARSA